MTLDITRAGAMSPSQDGWFWQLPAGQLLLLERSCDGFAAAERDLAQRGAAAGPPGTDHHCSQGLEITYAVAPMTRSLPGLRPERTYPK